MPNQYNKTLTVSDGRYPIEVNVNGSAVFTLYFNPGDAYIYEHLAGLETLPRPDMKGVKSMSSLAGRMKTLTDALDEHFDAIFGDGAARNIFKYVGVDMALIHLLVEKVREGIADHNEKAGAQRAEQRKKDNAAAKQDAKAFIANK